jgi:uncharacterized membrane protein YbhN (UPF0104 family)
VTRRLLRAALALGLLALLWQALDGAEVAARLARLDPVWLGVALGLLFVQTLLSALRWRLTAGRLGQAMTRGHALREYFLAQSVNLTLPGGVLGDAARALRAGATAGLERGSQAVLFERLAGQAALVGVALLAGGLSVAVPGGLALPAPLAVAFAVLAGGLVAAAAVLPRVAARRPVLARWLAALRWSVLHRDVALRQAALSLGTVAANVLSFAAAAAATGLVLPAGAVFALLPLVLFAMLIPFGIGGWGFREGAAVALLPMAGASAEAAFTASAAFGLVFLTASLSGLALSWCLARLPRPDLPARGAE